ncbi:MAG: molybdenum cofactor guanylyltransferase MobA [Gammaproteobacteria bacterium]|jgi:molybdenum cofactor guanylyltransferase
MPIEQEEISAVILAGGRGERMGGLDKGLLRLAGKPLVRHLIDSLQPQVHAILINANRHLDQYRAFGCPVIEDRLAGFAGPMAGIASALHAIETPYLLVVPCDTPALPGDLVRRLADAANAAGRRIAVAHDGSQLQLAHLLLPVSARAGIDAWLASGRRSIRGWLEEQDYAAADFSDQPQAFEDIDSLADLETP